MRVGLRIALGADHAGVVLKDNLARLLEERGIAYRDFGTHGSESVDYPDFAADVAHAVAAGDYDRVFKHLNIAISLRPDYFEAYNNLGVAHYSKGRYREAVAALREAIRLKPDYDDALYNLGLLQVAANKRREALVQYQKLKGLNSGLADRLFGGIYRGMILELRNK